MCDSCGFFLEVSHVVSAALAQDTSPVSYTAHPSTTGTGCPFWHFVYFCFAKQATNKSHPGKECFHKETFDQHDLKSLEITACCVPLSGVTKDSDGSTGHRMFFCCQRIRDRRAYFLALANQSTMTSQGTGVHGCYRPLSKGQLLWHIGVNDVTKHVEKEQIELMKARAPVPARTTLTDETFNICMLLVIVNALWTGGPSRHPAGV